MLLGLTSSLAIWGSLLIANILMLVASRLSGGLNLMSSGLPLLLIIGLTLLAYALMPSLTHLWAKLPAQGISLFAPH
jgi:flagellar biosynthesis protein FliR